MIKIPEYKQVNFLDFQTTLNSAYKVSGKPKIQIAADINVKSPATVSNALEGDKQVVSDEVLTSVMRSIGLVGFVLWVRGRRYYYIKAN
jgi:hypothetical protein